MMTVIRKTKARKMPARSESWQNAVRSRFAKIPGIDAIFT